MDKQLLSKEIVDILEYRIQQEELSARIYDQMRMWFDNKGYKNLAKLYEAYVSDENIHAGWAKEFLLNYGITPKLRNLPTPNSSYETCIEVLEATLEHELEVTRQCEELALKAMQWKSMTLYSLGMKYCEEQREEISKAIDILDHAKLTSDMLILDHYIERYL